MRERIRDVFLMIGFLAIMPLVCLVLILAAFMRDPK